MGRSKCGSSIALSNHKLTSILLISVERDSDIFGEPQPFPDGDPAATSDESPSATTDPNSTAPTAPADPSATFSPFRARDIEDSILSAIANFRREATSTAAQPIPSLGSVANFGPEKPPKDSIFSAIDTNFRRQATSTILPDPIETSQLGGGLAKFDEAPLVQRDDIEGINLPQPNDPIPGANQPGCLGFCD